jgi:pimeloyl-ACP methyl ester carboxylesterase
MLGEESGACRATSYSASVGDNRARSNDPLTSPEAVHARQSFHTQPLIGYATDVSDCCSPGDNRVITSIIRWSIRVVAVLCLTVVAAIAAFRLAAVVRETADRDVLAPVTGHLIPTGSGMVFVQEKGPPEGVPVVLFHGTAAWSELWRRTIDALAEAGFHVIALDLPPFGFSDRPGGYTRRDQAARVDDVLAALKASPAVIVGHSFGAGAATELAMRYPERVRGLVLVDAALGLTSPAADPPWPLAPKWVRETLVSLTITNPLATRLLLRSLIAKKERALPDYVEILQRPIRLRHSTPDIAEWLHDFLGTDRTAESADRKAYARLRLPVAILWGESDTVTPRDQARDLQALLPVVSLTLLPGLGHIPQIEDPDMFNDALLRAVRLTIAGRVPQ